MALLRTGQANRRVGETNMNERSSRSHRWEHRGFQAQGMVRAWAQGMVQAWVQGMVRAWLQGMHPVAVH